MKNKNYDVVIIGSGLNSLVCALLLAKRGIKPLVLERNASFGGCIHTTELFPGYHHELMASWYPLFLGGGAYQRIQSDLASVGVEFLNNGYTSGVITPAGHSLVLKQDVADTIQRIDQFAPGDGQAFNAMVNEIFEKNAELLFGMLGNSPYKWSTFKLLYQQWRKRGLDDLLGFAKGALTPFRTWSQQHADGALGAAFRSRASRRRLRIDRKAYLCRRCGGWHASSKRGWSKTRRRVCTLDSTTRW